MLCKHGSAPSMALLDATPAAVPLSQQRHAPSRRGIVRRAAPPDAAFEPGREGEVRRTLFNRISSSYDELNNKLSFGQHWVWKRMAVKWSGAKPGQRVLDVCCGSGDLAFLLSTAVGQRGQVVGLDFAAEMLADARQRQDQLQHSQPATRSATMQWVQGDAMQLPFSAGEFDAATMGYGLRNVASIPAALAELQRVLRPGGRAAILDFNNSQSALVDAVQVRDRAAGQQCSRAAGQQCSRAAGQQGSRACAVQVRDKALGAGCS
ncbi:hypothetical protein QJQ45_029286 [Haematococcus lacustris]|nr:hypothetical protein QJQ45_029286 [Haematococcus lacustris]